MTLVLTNYQLSPPPGHCAATRRITYIHKHWIGERLNKLLIMSNDRNIKIDSKFDSEQV